MNERIKELRKTLGLTLAEFGSHLGISATAISNVEKNKNNLSEQSIKLIYKEFNVNEEWLRYGKGDMFIDTQDDYLSAICKQYNLDDFSKLLIKNFIELDSTQRTVILDYINKLRISVGCDDISIEQEVQAYRQRLLKEKEEKEVNL